jgi:hypothetical protein
MNNDEKEIDELLNTLNEEQTVSFGLGTPHLTESNTFRKLIAKGPSAVPHLLRLLQLHPTKKITAYIVMALGQLSDNSAIKYLVDLQTSFQHHEPKDMWDYAVIGQCKIAIENLEKKS